MNIKNIKNKVWLTLATIIFTLTSCVHNKKDALIAQENKAKTQDNIKNNPSIDIITIEKPKAKQEVIKEKNVITIWVHGTKMMGLQDHVFKDFFFRTIGLNNINKYLDKHKITKIAKTLNNQNTHRFEFNNFYVYGWSGELSHNARKLAAKDLHKSILKLIQDYKQKNCITPKIRLITHSHGGNVALNLAKINNKSENKITIFELILLACPVQKKTCDLISNNMFEKIYSLYSQIDMLQVIDPQGLHKYKKKEKKPLFSQRTFTPQEKLTQAKIKINGRGIMHVEFITEKFAKLLPNILIELDQWNAKEINYINAQTKMKCIKIHTKAK